MCKRLPFYLFGLLLYMSYQTAEARIKLITLPVRDRVEIQLDHPDQTLVEEERTVPLSAGLNQVDFSWANTRIDPQSIVFRILKGDSRAEVNVLSVSYPPGERALVWNVSSGIATTARVRISYVIAALTRHYDYQLITSHREKSLTLMQYLNIRNGANEVFGDSWIWPGFGKQLLKSVGINQTRRVLIDKYQNIPVNKTYTVDPVKHGWLIKAEQKLLVPMHYVLKNDTRHGLGRAAIPRGKVRIFQEDGNGGRVFLGEDWGATTPLDEEMALFVGVAKDIVVKRTIEQNKQKRLSGMLYSHDVVIKYEIENFKDIPVTLTVIEHPRQVRDQLRRRSEREVEWRIGSKTSFKDGPDSDKTTLDKLVFKVDLPARSKSGAAHKQIRRLHLQLNNEW
ncbi:MAG: hypothetical protein BMS9Abin15_0262 [Gammaproteobacteria bacterium]|nr:MAG: hypothetical protein BMS9Abin15_0262 [Gammaproteobacteria bacterium]